MSNIASITVRARGLQSVKGLEILREMKTKSLQLKVITYNSSIRESFVFIFLLEYGYFLNDVKNYFIPLKNPINRPYTILAYPAPQPESL